MCHHHFVLLLLLLLLSSLACFCSPESSALRYPYHYHYRSLPPRAVLSLPRIVAKDNRWGRFALSSRLASQQLCPDRTLHLTESLTRPSISVPQQPHGVPFMLCIHGAALFFDDKHMHWIDLRCAMSCCLLYLQISFPLPSATDAVSGLCCGLLCNSLIVSREAGPIFQTMSELSYFCN